MDESEMLNLLEEYHDAVNAQLSVEKEGASR